MTAANETSEVAASGREGSKARWGGWWRRDWFQRHAAIALLGGLGLGAVGQVLVFVLARGAVDATVMQRVVAWLCSTALWLLLAFVAAWMGHHALASQRGRVIAIAASALMFGLLATLTICGVALRIMSGSYLTAGALVFLANSSEHFVHGAFGNYAGTALSIVGTLATTVVMSALALRRAATATPAPKRHRQAAAVLLVMLTVLMVARKRVRFLAGLSAAGPLMALVGSMDEDFELRRISDRPDGLAEAMAPAGPPLAEGERWKEGLKPPTTRPNILIIMLESVTPRHMSGYGYARQTTVELDRLAREGLWWRRAWTTATHSNYAQMAVISSLFPRRGYGLDQYTRLDYPRLLWHDALHAIGYPTATVSSQDENWQGMLRFQKTGTPTFFWFSDDFTGTHLDSGVEKVVPDDETTSVALDWLRRTPPPWGLYINFQATHFPYSISPSGKHPYEPDEPTWSTFNYLGYPRAERDIVINRYDNALRHVDEQIGRLRHYLEQTEQLENTLWIITSDHGEMFFEKDLVTHGKTLYQLETHVPLIFHWPARIDPETRDEPVSNLDVLPTTFDFLGIAPHPSWQGRSLRQPPSDGGHRHAVYMNIQGLRTADALVCWPYKLILDRTSNQPFLYDLEHDPKEQRNLIDQLPEVAKQLNTTLSKQLIAQMDYHAQDSSERVERFQPRLRRCPRLQP